MDVSDDDDDDDEVKVLEEEEEGENGVACPVCGAMCKGGEAGVNAHLGAAHGMT